MKRTSPPAPVTESPVATPGTAVRSAASWKKRWRRARRGRRRRRSRSASRLARRDLRRRLSQQLAELALEPAHARLAGVLGDDLLEERVGDLDLVVAQSVALDLARPQVAAGDRDLLVGCVAVEAHDLHPVEQRPGNRLGDVRRCDEQDLGEVELDVEVVVAERVVLRRVEDLEQGRARVAAPVGADLVDLVEHDHWVDRLRVLERADESAGQGADVGAPVAADLGLVADAAERHADELAAGGARDRLADRGLAGPGRADQRQDRSRAAALVGEAALLAQPADRDVLGDPVLDVLEAGVVGVEHLAGVDGVESLLGALAPRHADQPIEVGADHRRLAARLAHPLEPAELALGLLADCVRHLRLLDLLRVLLDDRGVVLAELLADRLHLLAQQVLALLLLGAGLDVVADPAADLELGQPLALELERELEPLGDVDRLEQALLVGERDVRAVARCVGERAGVGDGAQEGRDPPVVAAQLEDLLDDRAVLALELARALAGGGRLAKLLDLDHELATGPGAGDAAGRAVEAGQGHRRDAAG